MLYAAALAALFGAAGLCAERATLLAGRPARGVWAAVMVLSLALPAVAVVRRPAVSASLTPGPADVARRAAWEALLARAARRAAGAEVAPTTWPRLDRPLALGWVAAALLLLGRRVVAARRLARRARAWPRRVVAGTRVRVADDAGPAVMGALRPEIVVPAWALADARLALVLRHEEEHRRARDPLLLAAAEVAVACAPWNPALWWQLGRLRAAIEVDCDRRVLGGPPHASVDRDLYGRLLLDVAGRAVARPSPAPALAAWRTTTLERRIRTMTAPRPAHAALRALVPSGLALAAGAAAAALPRPSLVGAQPPAARVAVSKDSMRGKHFRAVMRDSGRVAEVTPVDSAGRPTGEPARIVRVDTESANRRFDSTLVVVNGREVGRGSAALATIAPDSILRVDVLKGETATRKYGARGRTGVVEITMKSAAARP